MRHTVKLPDAISHEARHWAAQDGMSVDKWLTTLTQKECTRRGLVDYSARLKTDPQLASEQDALETGTDTLPNGGGNENHVRQGGGVPCRGEIWSVHTPDPRTALVISSNLYNEVADYPYVLVVFLAPEPPVPPLLIQVGTYTALVDSLQRVPKPTFREHLGEVEPQDLAAVEEALHRILTTS